MSGLTDDAERALLDAATGKTAISIPSLYIGASSTAPTEAGANFTEPAGSAYARVELAPASWTAASAGDPSSTSYGAQVRFPTATASWSSSYSHFGLFSTPSGGVPLAWGTLGSSPILVETNDRLEFPAGTVRIELGDPTDFTASSFSPEQITGLVAAWDFSDTGSTTASLGKASQVDGAYGARPSR